MSRSGRKMSVREQSLVGEILDNIESRRAKYLQRARKAAIQVANSRQNKTATIDDVRDICPPPKGMDPRVMGAVFRDKDKWQGIGYENSIRAECHHRPIQRFKLLAA